MDGEQEPIAPVEPEAPAIEQEMEPNPPELADGEPPEAPEPDEDLEEFDWDGKKIKGPKGLKDGVLMHADYTRKTQEVAATRKELEERAQRLDQQFKASDEEMNARAALIAIDGDLKSYDNVDWDAWEQTDPLAAQAGFRKWQQLQAARSQVANHLNEKQNARTVQAQQDSARRLQETRQYAETKIKGWTPEIDAKVTDFATKELGFTWDMLKSAYNPAIYRTLHLAWLGHQALNTKPATSAPKPPPTEPLKVVAAKANPPAAKSLSAMSMEEYAAHRKKQEAARR
ncbi:hypothetical protein [Mesorhizobium sp. M4B.F.Ca.ET.143.01.1.1]|uniref:hypothetical protein n=1 Tax=Mesorhizobium sp. M4B.F.Ca.ET.143.01.1.1 TaxID=2563947 RepID=UPI0010940CD4|nr:hypothetical protein [Mesorhizobium sp. M4B.F.Ca.ET.143.01.1.1]TGV26340.1 hypothetical protein EN786_12515 [Mesorhizobium sp. M4B.F.Ca.ET.143.01.1.1]